MTSLVQPTAVVALANARLRDAAEALSRKLDATTVDVKVGGVTSGVVRSRFGPTERRVLGLVTAAADMLGGADQAAVPTASPLYPGPSRYAVLGSAGFRLTSYADLVSEGGDWRSSVLRRGTPDPDRSLVVVPTTTFANAAGAAAVAAAGRRPGPEREAATRRAEAFALGLLAAVAQGVTTGPVQRGTQGLVTRRRWSVDRPGGMISAEDGAVLRRLVGGDDPAATWRRWWPAAAEAAPFWDGLFGAIDTTYGVDHRDPRFHGWADRERQIAAHPGPPLSPARLATGYDRLLADAAPWGTGTWFGVLTPFLLSPTIALLVGLALPGARRFASATDPLTDRSFTELYSLASSISAVSPFVASMVMWAGVPEHTEAFANALALFLVRAGLFAGWLPTIGSEDDDPAPEARWALAGGMLAADGYALTRALLARGGPQPGRAAVFGIQVIPGVLALTALAQGALVKGAIAATKELGGDDGTATALGGVTLALAGLGTWLGVGLPLAHALAGGGGWMSWFRTTSTVSLAGALAALDASPEPGGPAALFDDSTLWHDPATATPTNVDLRYPTGGRALARVWRTETDGTIEIAQEGHLVRIRKGTDVTEVQIGPGARSVADLVAALAAVPGVQAAAVDEAEPYDLPWPATLADPSVDRDPAVPPGDPARGAFIALPTSEADAVVLRHAPDADLTTPFGLAGPGASRFTGVRLVPQATLGDLEDTGLGAAADLALLLCLGAASRLRRVDPARPDPGRVPGAPAVPGPIGAVSRVFRDWNLDDRRVNEWRLLVSGGAALEDAPPAAAAIEGERVAHALGWVPLWRAWLRVAADPTQDAASSLVAPGTPLVRSADGEPFRPSNAQLSAGIRYLLELPA